MPKFYNKVPFIKKSDSYWSSLNPILLDGEIILVSDDDGGVRIKVGDGISVYNELKFITADNIDDIQQNHYHIFPSGSGSDIGRNIYCAAVSAARIAEFPAGFPR